MLRKVTLAKGALLWDAGDGARTLAVVEKGRLAVRSDKGYLSLIGPKMILGEAALLTLDGESQTRTAAVEALEDDTAVVEYPASMVKDTFDAGTSTVGVHLLMTLVSQTCKNYLLIVSAHPKRTSTALLLKNQVQALSLAIPQLKAIAAWDEFFWTFKFLYTQRLESDRMRARLVGDVRGDSTVLAQASQMVQEFFKGQDIATYLDEYMAAEKEKQSWLEVERKYK